MTDLLAPSQVAAVLGLTEATLARWRKSDKGPPYKTRGLNQAFYDPAELVAWCEENRILYDLGAIEQDAVADG